MKGVRGTRTDRRSPVTSHCPSQPPSDTAQRSRHGSPPQAPRSAAASERAAGIPAGQAYALSLGVCPPPPRDARPGPYTARRPLLEERFGAGIEDRLLPLAQFHPVPTAAERAAWRALPAELHREVVACAEARCGQPWPALPATLFMDFRRTGDRNRYQRESFARRSALAELVAGECAEGAGRFVDDIVNGIWAICEESFWGVPAHNDGHDPLPDVERPVFDLFAGETAALLCWTHYLLRPQLDAVSPRVAARIRGEVQRRILGPFLERDDFWWMGLQGRRVNNWNPWCLSNALAAGLLLAGEPARRAAIVAKVLRCLDRFLDPHPADGGCDEGPSYWDRAGGALFDCLELLHAASGGAIDVYGEPLIREIARFLYRAHIDGEWFVNFADAPARVRISADLVHRFGQRIGDAALAALGASAHAQQRARGAALRGPLPRLLPALFHREALAADAAGGARPPYARDVWLPVIQVMAARERAGTPGGLYVAAKGGHNDESHNHNDVGQFIVYLDGRPLVIDAGVGTYTAQTFSARRYEIWTMRSPYHNLPAVRGVEQQPGESFRARAVAYRADADLAELSLDLADAYPPEAGLTTWRRAVRLVRGDPAAVEIVDDFRLAQATDDVRLSLILADTPLMRAAGRIETGSGRGAPAVLLFDAALDAAVETITLEDERLRGVWGPSLWRVTLRPRQAVASGTWRLTVRRADAQGS